MNTRTMLAVLAAIILVLLLVPAGLGAPELLVLLLLGAGSVVAWKRRKPKPA